MFTYTIASPNIKAPLSFQLGGGRAFSPQIEGQGELDLSAAATVTLALGVLTGPDIPLAERVRLQFRAEAFNIANHANFGLPENDIASPNFGRILSAGPPRLIQFGLKLLY